MSPLTIFIWALLIGAVQTRTIRRQKPNSKDVANDTQVTADPHILESAGMFQGDIAGITNATAYLEQYNDAMNQSLKLDSHGNAVKSPFAKWPKGIIPYAIHQSISTTTRNVVTSAMKEIQEKTCIKFVPRSNEIDYVNIVRGQGCYSSVGNQHLGPQTISLGEGCEYHSTAVHEIMHSIGFFHEQSRNDRDNYVNIYWSRVKPGMADNFKKMELDVMTHLGTQYDYGSVMHYNKMAFGNNEVTIEAKGQPSLPLGNYIGLSTNDALKINLLYECKGKVKDTESTKYHLASTTSKSASDNSCMDVVVNGVNRCAEWVEALSCGSPNVAMKCRKTCHRCW